MCEAVFIFVVSVQGLPPIAREAADKMGQLVVIEQNATDFSITRKFKLCPNDRKDLKFNQNVCIKNINVSAVPP